ncbi:hypothetical protein D3C80_2096630 [compost metagenome]
MFFAFFAFLLMASTSFAKITDGPRVNSPASTEEPFKNLRLFIEMNLLNGKIKTF